MNIVSLQELKSLQYGERIRVRVCKTWRLKQYGSSDQFDGLQCILVDIMILGCIAIVQGLEQKMLADARTEAMCEVSLENLRNERVQITLWSDAARTFSSMDSTTSICGFYKPPGKIVLNNTTSTSVIINPEIPELQAYKAKFDGLSHAMKKMPFSATMSARSQQLQPTEKLTAAQLNIINTDAYK